MSIEPAALLGELIARPSVNPAFLPSGDTRGGETAVGEFLLSLGRRLGLAGTKRLVRPGRYNFFLRLAPAGKRRHRVILAPHLDTVNAEPAAFRPRRREQRLYGRGACDTKGSVAAMVAALARLARKGTRPRHTEILFAGLADEEHGQLGSRALAKSGPQADFAIVGEPTRHRVVTAHKGVLWLRMCTRGRAAHGARPELGRNAIREAAALVELLEGEYAEALRSRRHALLGAASVNVGFIAGGAQPNIVPDACRLEVDRRTLPGETRAGVLRELKARFRRARLRVEVAPAMAGECPAMETAPSLPWVQQFLRLARQRSPLGVDYFCDAAILAAAGMPVVVFGPGDIAQAHTAEEWISLRSLERATDLLEKFLRSLP